MQVAGSLTGISFERDKTVSLAVDGGAMIDRAG